MTRFFTLSVATLWFVVSPWLYPQTNPQIPPGYALMDDMILPESVVYGDSAFTATPWPFGVVPFAFNANVSAANQDIALRAMQDISAVCGVIFIPQSTTPNWIIFNASNVNNSFVGMVGGGQVINVTSWGFKYIVVHEIMHALGYLHEQQRPDRDSFVQINFGNISTNGCSGQSCVGNFSMVPGSQTPTPYDFLSIMHYTRTAFTANGQDTITCLPAFAGFQSQLGNRTFMTLDDAAGLQARYGLSLVTPTLSSITPPFVTTATGSFVLHVYGSNFHGGSPNNNGVQGTKITWNGNIIPTTYEDSGHLSAVITASMIAEPQQVTISVTNPAPGVGFGFGSATLSVSCQSGNLLLSSTPQTVTNGCQLVSITPAYNTCNVVGLASISDWNIQMGPALAAAGGNECDFVVGSGFFGANTVTPTVASLTIASGFSPARVVHLTTTPLPNGSPLISSIPAGSNMTAFHFSAFSAGGRTFHLAGPSNLRWKLVPAGLNFAWRSSETNAVASGQAGVPVTTSIGSGVHCLVVYKNGSALTSQADFTFTMCFDFTPTPLTSSNNVVALNPGACVPFTLSPQAGKWNVVGASAASDWDIQVGPVVSQQGGTNCDYVLANGHLGPVTPTTGICSPYSPPGALGGLQFGLTATAAASLGTFNSPAADIIEAFEFEVVTPGNYNISVSATGYNWDLHGPGTTSAWRSATNRIAGPFSPATVVTVPNLDSGWHCIVVYHNGGYGLHGFFHSATVNYSSVQAPSLTSITPDTAPMNGATFTLTAYGSDFSSNSEVLWNGLSLPTVFASSAELSATVDASLLLTPGAALVRVLTPGAGQSAEIAFTIGNAVPTVTLATPTYFTAGDATQSVSVLGSDFVPASEVRIDGIPLPTTFVNETELTSTIDASLLVTPTARILTVFNPAPAGGESSSYIISVTGPYCYTLTPSQLAIQPPSSPLITVTVSGIYFTPWSVVHVQGTPVPTTFIDLNTLDATIDPNLYPQCSVPGALGIIVVNTVDAISPILPLIVDGGNNVGLIRMQPPAPAPDDPFGIWSESPLSSAPYTLILDLGQPTPVGNFPTATENLVIGVTELATTTGPWAPIVDGMGLLSPADGSQFDSAGVHYLPGFVMPNPALNISITLQGVYLDPAAPLGINLTWPLHTFQL